MTASSSTSSRNPYAHLLKSLPGGGDYYDFSTLDEEKVRTLPYAIRVFLENVVRNCDNFEVKTVDVERVLDWENSCAQFREFAYKPARVLLQDLTGVPSCVDLAAMRDCIARLGGDVHRINPLVPVDLVIDHSVQVDCFGSAASLEQNEGREFERNQERFRFLKWAASTFSNMLIVPPGNGICHQVNLEYLTRVVFEREDADGRVLLFPDTCVGTDSHTTMVGALGVLGWGVGGIEAEAVMLGLPISLVLPQVQGFELTGELPPTSTATDLVLRITNILRAKGVVGKIVEFFGPGVATLSLADRATISNMSPEYGATCGFFAVDEQTLKYLKLSARDKRKIDLCERYLRAVRLFRDAESAAADRIKYSGELLRLDLATVEPCLSGPKRPQDVVPLTRLPAEFEEGLTAKVGFKGYGLPAAGGKATFTFNGEEYTLSHGSVVIAAITSCTNTSNPSVMLGAAILAKNAVDRGLSVRPYIKTSLSPGSRVVESYLKASNLLEPLQRLNFYQTGFGCQTCIGNSGELPAEVCDAVTKQELVVAAVLSGNRNFEGRVHPLTRANYLASPMLVVAFALAGNVRFDFEKEPLGHDAAGAAIFLRDIWPSRAEIAEVERRIISPEMFASVYRNIKGGSNRLWQALEVEKSPQYAWDPKSTYVHNPPFFDKLAVAHAEREDVANARILCLLGDSITTDHISPAGAIAKNSPAAAYLLEHKVQPRAFNTYGSRRGNDEIMVRGTFANIRLINEMSPKPGPYTVHFPSKDVLPIFDAAERYKETGTPLVIIAGKEYGTGSSRDWAAKGPWMLNVKAVISVSFERIHRSNLLGMGVLPLEFASGVDAHTLGLKGDELISIELNGGNVPVQGKMVVKVEAAGGNTFTFDTRCRIDTEVELEYFKNGGILHYVLRKLLR